MERERLALEKQKFLDEAQLATMRRQWEEEERENDRKRLQETRRLEKEELVRIEEMRELERQLNQAKLAKQVQLMQARQQTPNLGLFFKNVSCTVSLGLLC